MAGLLGIPATEVTDPQLTKLRIAFVYLVYGQEGTDQVRDAVSDMCGIKLTDDQAINLMLDSRSIGNWYAAGCSLDTVMREGLADTLAKEVLGRRRWPTYGEGGDESFQGFLVEFGVKARALGYIFED